MTIESVHPVVEVQGLRYRYAQGDRFAVSVDELILNPSEQIVLTGQSGCGKSTLLHLIAGLMDPSEGTIKVAGAPMASMKGSRRDRFRGQHIGMVFQTFQLLHGFSVLENVLAAMMFSKRPRGEHRTRAMALLDTLGINTPNARAEELSIGQQQRVAVARALACSPSVVLADEPTAALDPSFATAAMDLLQESCRENNAALICVTHDVSMVSRFDRHHQLEDLASVGSGT